MTEKWVEARDIAVEIEQELLKIAEMIEDADTREEADKIYHEISRIEPAGNWIAKELWDNIVDWKKVRWEDKEREVV